LAAMTRRGVNESGAGVVADVAAGEQRNLKGVIAGKAFERVLASQQRQLVGINRFQSLEFGYARVLKNVGGEFVGQHEPIAWFCPIAGRRISDFVESIFNLWRETDRSVAGNRPRRRRPNYNRCTLQIVLLRI